MEERLIIQKQLNSTKIKLRESEAENEKYREVEEQLKERMNTLRVRNKQLEAQANTNYVMLRKNDIFRVMEDRMVAAEARVQQLESSLSSYFADFENMNADFTICAEKLQQAEIQIEEL